MAASPERDRPRRADMSRTRLELHEARSSASRDMPRVGSVDDSCQHCLRYLVDPGSRVV